MKRKLLKTLRLIVLILLSVVLGKVIGGAVAHISYLSWLNIGANFGFSPVTVDLAVVQLTVGFMMSINVCQIILLLIAILAYTKIKIRD